MKGKKSNSGRTKSTHQVKNEGAIVPDTKPNQCNEDFGNLVPSIQAVPTDEGRGALVPGYTTYC